MIIGARQLSSENVVDGSILRPRFPRCSVFAPCSSNEIITSVPLPVTPNEERTEDSKNQSGIKNGQRVYPADSPELHSIKESKSIFTRTYSCRLRSLDTVSFN